MAFLAPCWARRAPGRSRRRARTPHPAPRTPRPAPRTRGIIRRRAGAPTTLRDQVGQASADSENATMTGRKPPGMRWESWIDRQVREAEERGEFEGLPGAGQPIPISSKPHDELWWVKDKLRREGLTYMSPSVALRKRAHDALQSALGAKSEAEVRQPPPRTSTWRSATPTQRESLAPRLCSCPTTSSVSYAIGASSLAARTVRAVGGQVVRAPGPGSTPPAEPLT